MPPRKHRNTNANRVGFVISCCRGQSLPALGIAIAVASGFGRTVVAQQAPTRQHIETLASEKLDGRLTGSAGERLAADYIVSQLQRIGAKTVPGLPDYRVPFQFTAGNRDGGSSLSIKSETAGIAAAAGSASGQNDSAPGARALSFSDNAEVEGPVVFAGYGIVVPGQPGFRLRQLRRSRRQRQDRPRAALLPRGRRSENEGNPRALLGSPIQGDGRAATRRESDSGRHRPTLSQRRRARAHDVRHGDCRLGHRRGQHHRRRRPAIFLGGARQDARLGAAIARYREPTRRRFRVPRRHRRGSHRRRA